MRVFEDRDAESKLVRTGSTNQEFPMDFDVAPLECEDDVAQTQVRHL